MIQKPTLPSGVTGERKESYKLIANRLFANANAIRRARELTSQEALQAFDDGASVDTPDGFGIIDDIITEGSVDDMDASDDDPVYAVVVEDESVGVGFYREGDLSDASVDDLPGPEDPTDDLEAMADIHNATGDTEALQDGFFEWPESWEESEQPARVIALKAWAGMGGSFTGCTREMRGSLTGSPDRFCADFKDRLYGTEQWRGGWGNEALAGQSGTEPFADNPVIPTGIEELTPAWLIRWAEWVAAGKPSIPPEEALDWNPALHPRNPENGKFVERSFNVPDDLPDFEGMGVKGTLEYLDEQGEDVDAILDPESGVTIDGVPNDATAVEQIPDDADVANPEISDTETPDLAIGESVSQSDVGDEIDGNEIALLESGDKIAVNGEVAELQTVAGDNRTFLYNTGDGTEEGDSFADTIRAIDTAIDGADPGDDDGDISDETSDVTDNPNVADEIPDSEINPNPVEAGDYGGLATEASSVIESEISDAEKVSQIEELVSQRADVEADFGQFAPNQAAEAAAGVSAVLEREGSLPDSLETIRAGVTPELNEQFRNEPIAGFHRPGGTGQIDLSLSQFTEDNVAELNDDGWLTGDQPRDVMVHELGHALHYQRTVDGDGAGMNTGGMNQGVPLGEDTTEAITETVSDYAAENFPEFVAEAYVERVTQGGIDESEMNLPGLLDYALGEDNE